MRIGLAVTLVSALLLLPPVAVGQSPDTPAPEQASPAEITGSAQRVFLDPQTGRLVSERPPGVAVIALSPEELRMLSTSHRGLDERPLPEGGYMLDLQGRFRNVAVATVAEDGTIVIHEVAGEVFLPAGPAPSEKNESND